MKWEHWLCLLHRVSVKVEQDNPYTVFGPVTGTDKLQWVLWCATQMPLQEQRTSDSSSRCWNVTRTPRQIALREMPWLKKSPHPRIIPLSRDGSQLTTDQHRGTESQSPCPNLGLFWKVIPASKIPVELAKALVETAWQLPSPSVPCCFLFFLSPGTNFKSST